jgi:flagellar hook assembly protein FlgD
VNIYDVKGRLVRALVSGEHMPAGRHEMVWEGRDEDGKTAATGVYFCLVRSASGSRVSRMALVE